MGVVAWPPPPPPRDGGMAPPCTFAAAPPAAVASGRLAWSGGVAPSPSMHVCSRAARRHEARRLGRPLPFDSGASVAVRACKKGVLRELAVGPGRSGQSVFCLIVFAPPPLLVCE